MYDFRWKTELPFYGITGQISKRLEFFSSKQYTIEVRRLCNKKDLSLVTS